MRWSRPALFYTLAAVGLGLVAWVSWTAEAREQQIESGTGTLHAILITAAVLLAAHALRKLVARGDGDNR